MKRDGEATNFSRPEPRVNFDAGPRPAIAVRGLTKHGLARLGVVGELDLRHEGVLRERRPDLLTGAGDDVQHPLR